MSSGYAHNLQKRPFQIRFWFLNYAFGMVRIHCTENSRCKIFHSALNDQAKVLPCLRTVEQGVYLVLHIFLQGRSWIIRFGELLGHHLLYCRCQLILEVVFSS